MAKSVELCAAKLISYNSTLSFSEARSRLEAGIHKQSSKSAKEALFQLRQADTRSIIVQNIEKLTQGGDFLYFAEYEHQAWLGSLTGHSDVPSTVAYTFGNPLIARYILERDLGAALFIPPRILLRENLDSKGIILSYYLPSSLLPEISVSDETLKAALLDLDTKIERLVLGVLVAEARL